MFGFYTDESGNNGFGDANQPILCYAGILVPTDKQVELDTQFQGISDSVLLRIKNTIKGIPNDELNSIPFFRDFELHAGAFLRGENMYSKIPEQDRYGIVDQIFQLLKNNDIQMYSVVMNKLLYKANTNAKKPYKMYELGYTELVNLLNANLNSLNQYCFIIADNGKPEEQQIFSNVLKQQSGSFRVYPDLQIKDSHMSNLIQIADFVAFISSVFYRQHYGFQNSNSNTRIVNAYTQHIAPNIKLWEYK